MFILGSKSYLAHLVQVGVRKSKYNNYDYVDRLHSVPIMQIVVSVSLYIYMYLYVYLLLL